MRKQNKLYGELTVISGKNMQEPAFLEGIEIIAATLQIAP